MNDQNLKEILKAVQEGRIDIAGGLEALRDLPYQDIGHTKIDHHRFLRNGFPEVIYAEGKSKEHVADIFAHMMGRNNVFATRVSVEMAEYVQKRFDDLQYNVLGRTLSYCKQEPRFRNGNIVIITAGTSDLGVAEEAKSTCEMLGNKATIISDIGVAGIHRLFDKIDEFRKADVLIVVAGMEGALSSVIGGLVRQPVIAVPTSVGYGANFGGLSALLGMLTSCASGITVANIDNGFGAACAACKITRAIDGGSE